MKPHSTCSKAVFATLVGCPTGPFTFRGPAQKKVVLTEVSPGHVPVEVLCLQVKGKHVRKQLALLSIGALSAWMYSRLD